MWDRKKFYFNILSIFQHVELNTEHLNFVREKVNLSSDIDLISTVITINDEPNWKVKEEEADYTGLAADVLIYDFESLI